MLTLEEKIDELISYQKQKLLSYATRIIPCVTEEDLLQPNDFPQLENHPEFRYEEGVLHGLMIVKTAFSLPEFEIE
ncbi:MAG: hypothetical protein Tsb0021_05720 [Chlamydiales bacterium]